MNFPELDFKNLNEADVREEVIAPLLRDLGYLRQNLFIKK